MPLTLAKTSALANLDLFVKKQVIQKKQSILFVCIINWINNDKLSMYIQDVLLKTNMI